MFRVFIFLLPFLLSGCGVSVLAHNEYITFSDVHARVNNRQVFESKGLYFRKIFTNQLNEYEGEKKEFVAHNVNVSFSEHNGGLVGLFPLIPPPPIFPVFLNNIDGKCPIETDTMMLVSYKSLENENKIDEFVKLKDKNRITLIRDDNIVITPRHMWSDGYVYYLCFPLKVEETDNMVLNVQGLVDNQGRELNFTPQLLHYYSDYIFAMAYLGGEPFRCNFSPRKPEKQELLQ